MASVLIPLAPGCEELEAVTIIDLLVRAGVEVVSAGLQEGPVKCSRGTVIIPDTTLDQALQRDYDMLVLPGGLPGADHLRDDERVLERVKKMHAQDKYIAAICAAPKVLASAGLLENRKVTGYPGSIDTIDINGMDYTGEAVVCDGKVVTSRGPGTAMDFALQLIGLLLGQDKRDEVEAGLVRA